MKARLKNAAKNYTTLRLSRLLLFSSLWNAFAQLQGHFSLEKGQYEVGEPVFLQFDLTNVGKESVRIIRGDRYSHCGGYKIEVSSGPPISHSSCDRGFAGSCLAGGKIVAPGETSHERLLLNYEHDLSKAAIYDIHAALVISYGSNGEDLSIPDGAGAGKHPDAGSGCSREDPPRDRPRRSLV